MRLSRIKLAGFKSFVDPTVFHVPSNRVGIVGPNGCGKSNVIDAVRWVMGESSVRQLRGDSMADVIFSGSASRKPVGQAFVELVFDNAHGRLGGAYAGYAEIAIKRLVERDGQSRYFLNGTRCRRRDVVDIFLGTGLGPRSYAIIGQDMISRIVEARPEDLRVFLEEAAGISKYKERRRETENRIRHSRDNLDRLNDLREELDKRLQQLQRQAQAAERYQRYKAEERRLKAELLALRWQALDRDVTARENAIRGQETALEAIVAEQRALEARLEAGRERRIVLSEALDRVQEQSYALGSEIARLEQTLAHRRELRERQREELHRAEQALQELQEHLRLDRERLAALEAELAEGEPALEAAAAVETEADEQLAQAEDGLREWQAGWEELNRRSGEAQRLTEVERTRIEHLDRQLLQHRQRCERLQIEHDSLTAAELDAELEALRRDEAEAEAALNRDQQALADLDAGLSERREAGRRLGRELDEIRERLQAGRGRLSSLETLQEAALGRREGVVHDWLRSRALDRAPRLAERLQVETGWEQAVETVLGLHLQAVCVEDLERPAAALAELQQGTLALFATGGMPHSGGDPSPANGALLHKVRAPWPLASLLPGIQVAADLVEALARRGELVDGESLITPDGTWIGRDWLRVARGGDDRTGVLAREREIQTLRATLDGDGRRLQQDSAALEDVRTAIQNLEQQRAELQDAVNRGHREHARLQSQANALHGRCEQTRLRLAAIGAELEELRGDGERAEVELQEARGRLEEALLQMEQRVGEREALAERRGELQAALEDHRAAAAEARAEVRQQALALESARSASDSLQQGLARLESQKIRLESRREQLLESRTEDDEPPLRERLEVLLGERLQVDEELVAARRAVEDGDAALRELEQRRSAQERQAQTLRQGLESERLGWREASVRRQTLLEQLAELDTEPAGVLAAVPAEAAEDVWQAELEKLAARIQRLGAINLAAIEEFEQLAERKRYLDAQNDDLVEALSTLENAMRRIDRETRARFQDTFERVNDGFRSLFPRLFGGGQAHLELTGEDLLDAGVTVMARPPGKRIGTIHLLSGGEKALTAVALVFSIFQLNPAPFCMLDEVDAPLDEANVGRFGELLREMSEQIQFIFITHNKATMEMARHLTGVTMHEPGVSRLVAVDVDEAVRMAVG